MGIFFISFPRFFIQILYIKIYLLDIYMYNRYIVYMIKTFKCKEEYYDDKGRKCTREVLRTSTDEVHVAADTQAISFYIKNRVPDDWKDKQTIEGSMEFSHKLEDLI